MAKSSITVSFLAILLIFTLIASTEIKGVESKKQCGWVYKSSCFKQCNKYCKSQWGALYGQCKWYHGKSSCLCYYGKCYGDHGHHH